MKLRLEVLLISILLPLTGRFAAGRRRALLIGLLGCGLASSIPALAADLPRLELSGDRVTAGDLARVIPAWGEADPSAVLSYAPAAGVQRRVSRSQLKRWARSADLQIDATELPLALIVSRRMRRLASTEALEALRSSLAQQYQIEPGQIEIELHGFSEPLVPDGELHFEAASGPSRLNTPIPLGLRWRNPDGRTGRLSFRATVEIHGGFAVAREPLPARTELSPADFLFQEGPLPGPPDQYLFFSDDIKGKVLRNRLNSGEPLSKRNLLTRHTVRRGDLIELRLQSRAITLRAPGRAEQAGSVGDLITCRNLQSGHRVMVTIVDRRHAEVVYSP